jgi:hypothetical protein
MDPHLQYKKQMEYYQYIERQRQNYIDLSKGGDPNDSVIQLASILFNKNIKNLDSDLIGIILDESMDVADLFCMLIELVLHGLHILTNNNISIFDLDDPYCELIGTMRSYLRSIGIDMIIREELTDEQSTYRDGDNYYCELVPKTSIPPNNIGWQVLDYFLIYNFRFKHTQNAPLETFNLFFVTKQNRLFVVKFKIIKVQ